MSVAGPLFRIACKNFTTDQAPFMKPEEGSTRPITSESSPKNRGVTHDGGNSSPSNEFQTDSRLTHRSFGIDGTPVGKHTVTRHSELPNLGNSEAMDEVSNYHDEYRMQTASYPTTENRSNAPIALDLSMKSHSGQSPHEPKFRDQLHCLQCKVSTDCPDKLREHFDTKHAHFGSYYCQCEEKFHCMGDLMMHQHTCKTIHCTTRLEHAISQKSHSNLCSSATHLIDEKWLICGRCGMDNFADKAAYLNHLTTCSHIIQKWPEPTSHSSQKSLERAKYDLQTVNKNFANFDNTQFETMKSTSAQMGAQFESLPNFTSSFPMNLFPSMGQISTPPPRSTHQNFGISNFHGHSTTQQSFRLPNRNFNGKLVENKTVSNISAQSIEDSSTPPDLSRPFKCTHCIKAFKSKALLDQHMHIHFPPKYTCRYCAKKYRWPPVFYHHQRTCKKRPPSTTSGGEVTVSVTNSLSGTHARTSISTKSPTNFQYNHGIQKMSPQIGMKSLGYNPESNMKYDMLGNGSYLSQQMTNNLLYDHLKNSEFNSYATAETMGLAALATAMFIRFPVMPPVPPPLGLYSPYHLLNSFGQNNYQNNQNFTPHISDMYPRLFQIPGPEELFIQAGKWLTTPRACNTTSSSYNIATDLGSKPTLFDENFQCLCGNKFENIHSYFNHIRDCSKLQPAFQAKSEIPDIALMKNAHSFSSMPPKEDKRTPDLIKTISEGDPSDISEKHTTLSEIPFKQNEQYSSGSPNYPSFKNIFNESTASKRYHEEAMALEAKKARMLDEIQGKASDSSHDSSPNAGELVGQKKYAFDIEEIETKSTKNTDKSSPNMETYSGYENTDRNNLNGFQCAKRNGNLGDKTLEQSSYSEITSTSLMAAMASVLANAASAAGFQCRGLMETSTDGEDCLDTPDNSWNSPNTTVRSCGQCGKEFSSRLSLKQHVQGKHSSEGKYQCPGCSKRYRWGASYYYHKKSCVAFREQSPAPDLNSSMSIETQQSRNVYLFDQMSEFNQQNTEHMQEPQLAIPGINSLPTNLKNLSQINARHRTDDFSMPIEPMKSSKSGVKHEEYFIENEQTISENSV